MTIAHNKWSVTGSNTNNQIPAAVEHQLVGHVSPKCARCQRTLMQIIAHPTIPCGARSLPLDVVPVTRQPARKDS